VARLHRGAEYIGDKFDDGGASIVFVRVYAAVTMTMAKEPFIKEVEVHAPRPSLTSSLLSRYFILHLEPHSFPPLSSLPSFLFPSLGPNIASFLPSLPLPRPC
jgi:hypothetical protein